MNKEIKKMAKLDPVSIDGLVEFYREKVSLLEKERV